MDMEQFIRDIPYLSFQQRRMLREQAQDLALWNIPGMDVFSMWPSVDAEAGKNEVRRAFSDFMERMDAIRHTPVDYSDFNPDYDFRGKGAHINTDFLSPDRIMGKCPCPRDGASPLWNPGGGDGTSRCPHLHYLQRCPLL